MKKRFLAIVTILLMIFTLIAPSINAFATENPLHLNENDNHKYPYFDSTNIVDSSWKIYDKIELKDDTYTSDDGLLKVTLHYTDNNQFVSWTYANGNQALVGFVYVKGGKNGGGNLYINDGTIDIYNNLYANKFTNGDNEVIYQTISHVSFFYKEKQEKLYSIKVIKTDDSNPKALLANVEFTLYRVNADNTLEKVGDPKTTDSNGIVIFDKLAEGTYKLSETKGLAGYESDKDDPKTIEISETTCPDNTIPLEVDYVNNKITKLYSIKVIKTDNGDPKVPLANVEFTLYKVKSDNTLEQVGDPKTTDTTGIVIFDKLAEGTYKLSETKGLAGYESDKDDPKTIEISETTCPDNTIPLEVDYVNNKITKLYSIKVIKTDNGDPKVPLANVEFTLYKVKSDNTLEQVGDPKTTDTSGIIIFDKLSEGTYKLSETKGLAGYESDKNNPRTIEINEQTCQDNSKPIEVYYINNKITKLYSIKVIKTDNCDPKAPLANIEFTLYKVKSDNTLEQVGDPKTTDSAGIVIFDKLSEGTYKLSETKGLAGYESDKNNPRTIEINEQSYQDNTKPIEVYYINNKITKLYSIKVIKTDNGDPKAPLADVEFTLYKVKSDNTLEQVGDSKTTDSAGIVIFDKLSEGTYKLSETKGLAGYESDKNNPRTIEINEQTCQDNSKPIEVYYINNKITKLYSIKVIKTDNCDPKAPLANVEFTLYKVKSDNTLEQVGDPKTTDSTGIVIFDKLVEGTYKLSETKGLDGYESDKNDPRIIEINEKTCTDNTKPIEEYYVNSKITKSYSIKVIKTDNGYPKVPLAGVEFTLYKVKAENALEQVGEPKTTDIAGIVTFDKLAEGTYKLSETKGLDGYESDKNNPRIIEINEKTCTDNTKPIEVYYVNNKNLKYNIIVYKVDSVTGDKLYGAVFTLNKKGDPDFKQLTGTTGSDGIVKFNNLESGTYIINETEAPNGYEITTKEKEVTVPFDDRDAEVTFKDNSHNVERYKISVLKVDVNDNNKKLSGAEFILTKEGDTVFSKTGTTGTDGYAVFSNLEAGIYHLRETKAPSGYDLSTETKNVTLPNNDGDAEITFEDGHETPPPPPPPTYSIKAIKVDDSDNSKLQGAEFTLTKQNSTSFKQTGITGLDGTVTFNNLLAGTYYVEETKAPEGYEISKKVETIVLPSGNGDVTVTFNDKKQIEEKYSIKIFKVDTSDKNKKLVGAEFTLTKDGDQSFKQTGITGADGSVVFDDLTAGTYNVQETKAPDGYEISTLTQTLTLPSENKNAEITFYDDPSEVIPEEPIPGSEPEIPVTDEPVPGAEPVLPKTGELPPELFYGLGATFILAGIFMKKHK